jgi:uncharacterized protein (DUF362 family)
MSEIYASKTNETNIYYDLKKALESLRINLNFKTAVIKLNFCSIKLRESGATSDPLVVEQIVRILNENNISVRLVESSSASKDADLAFDYLGFRSLEKKYDVKCVNLSRDQFSFKKIDGYHLKTIKVPKTIETAEFFITHPKLKTHTSLKIHMTGALKNQFGCLMTKNKAQYHSKIHEVIADINQVLKPDLAIMDAIIAMVGYGPTTGIPVRLNTLLVSRDLVAIDCLGAKILRINPSSIKYLKLASAGGVGKTTYNLKGDKLENSKVDLHMNKFITTSFELLSSLGIKAGSG